MSLTPSTMLPLKTPAIDFELLDVVTKQPKSLKTFESSKALLIMFICRHCPYVVHLEKGLAALGEEFAGSELGILAISSNDAEKYPDDGPEKLKEMAERLQFKFFLCYDQDQSVAKNYRAACTPDFFLFDENRLLVYRGQFDDSRPGNGLPVTGKDLRLAIKAALRGDEPDAHQIPSMGCNIKWKPGNAPDYFNG